MAKNTDSTILNLQINNFRITPPTNRKFIVPSSDIDWHIIELDGKPIPDSSCISRIDITNTKESTKSWSLCRKKNQRWTVNHQMPIVHMYVFSHNCHQNCNGNCDKNLPSGKCVDEYAIRAIGKIFWPEMYNNQQKTK